MKSQTLGLPNTSRADGPLRNAPGHINAKDPAVEKEYVVFSVLKCNRGKGHDERQAQGGNRTIPRNRCPVDWAEGEGKISSSSLTRNKEEKLYGRRGKAF